MRNMTANDNQTAKTALSEETKNCQQTETLRKSREM